MKINLTALTAETPATGVGEGLVVTAVVIVASELWFTPGQPQSGKSVTNTIAYAANDRRGIEVHRGDEVRDVKK